MKRLLPVLVLAALAAAPAIAQQQQQQAPRGGTRAVPAPAPAAPPAEPAPVPEPPPAPYEPALLRLSEIVGSLAFLRTLCAAPDGSEWPRRMEALLAAEGTTPGRRERLAGAYNRGYRAFALTYRVCTPAAEVAAARYLEEGERLSRDISMRYGG